MYTIKSGFLRISDNDDRLECFSHEDPGVQDLDLSAGLLTCQNSTTKGTKFWGEKSIRETEILVHFEWTEKISFLNMPSQDRSLFSLKFLK